jgi:hypothetical protein
MMIEVYDYIEPIKILSNYYNGSEPNYYEYLLNKFGDKHFDKPLFIKNYDYDLDEILLQYLKYFKNIRASIIWPSSNYTINLSDLSNLSKDNSNIHAIKEIYLTRKQIQGFIYQVYNTKWTNFKEIQDKQNIIGGTNNQNKIYIIFYEHSIQLPKNVNLSSSYLSDSYDKTIEIAQLVCNKNSIKLLKYQRIDRFFLKNFDKSQKMFILFKEWLYENINVINRIRFLLFSSIVLYTLGLREMNDLDLIIHHLPSYLNTSFYEKIKYQLIDESTKFPFIEASIKGTGEWITGGQKEYLNEWFGKEWPEMYGSKSMDETILNPRFHYYYLGIKIIIVNADIKRRIQRSRAAAYADLIAFIKLIDNTLKIPNMPKGYWKNHIYYDYTPSEINIQYKKISFYLKKRYNIKMHVDDIQKLIKPPS